VGRVGTVNAGRLATQKHAASLENRAQFSHKTELELLYALVVRRPALASDLNWPRLRLGLFVSASYSAAMRKSAKRGQPQIFLLCVTLWASAGGVVSARAFAVPVPNGIGRKQKRATLASTHWKGCWGLPFPQRKRDTRNEAAKKPLHVHNFGLSDWPSPFAERKGGDEGEGTASPPLHRRFDAQRLLSKKAARMGDKAKPLVSWTGGFAV
jgi:hypothetical protein